MTSKERAWLKSLAMKENPVVSIGKDGVTPESTQAVEEAITARELIKISVQKSCLEDPRDIAQTIAERTHSQVVQVIGRKIVLYRLSNDGRKSHVAYQEKKNRHTGRDL